MGNNILSIDQSSSISGYAVWKDDELIKYGSIDNSRMGEPVERISKLLDSLHDVVKDFKIDTIVIEDIYLQGKEFSNPKMFKVLAKVQGAIELYCYEQGIECYTFYPNEWKKIIPNLGKGRIEQKKSTQAYVSDKYRVKVNQDTADAIGIGSYYISEKEFA